MIFLITAVVSLFVFAFVSVWQKLFPAFAMFAYGIMPVAVFTSMVAFGLWLATIAFPSLGA